MEWTVGGITYEWSPDWWQAWGAILQAVLSAGAVFAAAALQDRGFAKRDIEIRNRRLEGVAAVARYTYAKVEALAKQLSAGMDANRALEVVASGIFDAPTRAIREIEPASLGNVELTDLFLRFEETCGDVARALGQIRYQGELNRPTGMPVNALAILGDVEVRLFNAAAGVERSVAALVKRRAML